MAVHIDEMVSEVTTEPEATETRGYVATTGDEQERWRAISEQIARDRSRLQAEDYDD